MSPMPFVEQMKLRMLSALARSAGGPITRRFSAVIFKVDAIGDFVLAVSAIRRLTEHYGLDRCCLVTGSAGAGVAAQEFPGVSRIVLSVPVCGGPVRRMLPQLLTARAALSRVGCDHVIALRHQRADYHDLLLSWIRTAHSVGVTDKAPAWMDGYRRKRVHFPFTDVVQAPPASVEAREGDVLLCRELRLHQALLSYALSRPVSAVEILPAFAHVATRNGNYLVVAPFAGTLIKTYPEPRLLECLDRIHARLAVPIQLTGSSKQKRALARLRAKMENRGIHDVEIRWNQTIAGHVHLVAGSRAVLAMDSATAHVATALNKPTVVILGGGHYGHFAPWRRSSRQAWLTHRTDCFDCSWKCVRNEPSCITGITPDEVSNALAAVMKEH